MARAAVVPYHEGEIEAARREARSAITKLRGVWRSLW